MSGTAAFSLPVLTLSAGYVPTFELPGLTLSATGSMTTSGGAFPLPVLSLSSAGVTGEVGEGRFNLPVLTLNIAAVQHGLGAGSLALPPLRLASTGTTGVIGTAAFSLPILVLSAAGHNDSSGEASFGLPALFLRASGAETLAEAYRTWVLNTRKGALTEYDLEFNSYAIFQGQVLAAGPDGIVVLGTQAQDAGDSINARARTANADFGETHLKRVPRIYAQLKTDGDLKFKTIVDATGERVYLLPHNHVSEFQQRRVPVGKGPKAVNWQFEVENVDGADFTLENFLIYPTGLRRRVK